MKAQELLSQFKRMGGAIWRVGEQIKYKAPCGMMTEDMRSSLHTHRQEILALLAADHAAQGHRAMPVPSPSAAAADRETDRQEDTDPGATFLPASSARDLVDDMDLRPPSGPPHYPPRDVFLTGATGFLGSFLLTALLERTDAKVCCLLRGTDPAALCARLNAALKRYQLPSVHFGDRVECIGGDLTQPFLGLGEARFCALSEKLDGVYHCAADVNLMQDYDALRPANVLGTKQILRLISLGQPKALHHVSTVGVFMLLPPTNGVVDEDDDIGDGGELLIGYQQTKWAAEKLVQNAASRGLPCAIYRPGVISGDSRTGIMDRGQLGSRQLLSQLRYGMVPDLQMSVDMAPVEYVGNAIAHISLRPDCSGGRFHLCNPNPITLQEMTSVFTRLGFSVSTVPFMAFKALLDTVDATDTGIFPLLSHFAKDVSFNDGAEAVALQRALEAVTTRKFSCTHTLESLQGSGIECPRIDDRLIGTYTAFLRREGLI